MRFHRSQLSSTSLVRACLVGSALTLIGASAIAQVGLPDGAPGSKQSGVPSAGGPGPSAGGPGTSSSSSGASSSADQAGAGRGGRAVYGPQLSQPVATPTTPPGGPVSAAPTGTGTAAPQGSVPLFPVATGWVITPDGTRVMCMGDSITSGFGGVGGYRYALWSLMLGANFAPDFVGSSTVASPFFMPDPEHEGHSGWRMADFVDHVGIDGKPDSSIELKMSTYRPTMILLHAGTNDLWSKDDWQRAPDDLAALLDRIHAHNPRVLTVVAKIVPTIVDSVNLSADWMNRRFHEVVEAKWLAGHNVQLVDMQVACPVLTTVDGVHPDQVCYTYMAEQFLGGILAAGLRVPPAPIDPPLVTGLTAFASTEEGSYLAPFAVDGTGMDGSLHADDEGSTNAWRSAPFTQVEIAPGIVGPVGQAETLTIQLGAAHDVELIEVFNGRSAPINGGSDWLALESIRRLQVETSLDGVLWVDRGQLELTQGPPRDRTPPERFAVDWPDTAHVRLTVLETYQALPGQLTSIDASVCLSEVRLRGLPSAP